MNLIYLSRRFGSTKRYTSIKNALEELPNADKGYLYAITAITYHPSFRDLLQKYRLEFGIPEYGYHINQRYKLTLPDLDKLLSINKWDRLEYLYIGEAVRLFFPYMALFNAVPVLFNNHITWEPHLNYGERNSELAPQILNRKDYAMYKKGLNVKKHQKFETIKEYEDYILDYPLVLKPKFYLGVNLETSVSRNAVDKYLDDNWKEIKLYMKELIRRNDSQQWSKFYISERDMEIYELYTYKKLTHNQIAERLSPNDNPSYLNQDSAKSAYHEAKAKIESLIMPQA